MTYVYLKGQTKATAIRHDRDFEDMLREHLGNDAADYYAKRLKDLAIPQDVISDLKSAFRSIINNIEDERDEILDLLREVNHAQQQ